MTYIVLWAVAYIIGYLVGRYYYTIKHVKTLMTVYCPYCEASKSFFELTVFGFIHNEKTVEFGIGKCEKCKRPLSLVVDLNTTRILGMNEKLEDVEEE